MEQLFYSEIDDANHYSVEAEDKHGADGDESDDAALDVIERF